MHSYTCRRHLSLRLAASIQAGDTAALDWHPSQGRLPTTWIHPICDDCGQSPTEALQSIQDRTLWRAIATATPAMRIQAKDQRLMTQHSIIIIII